MTFEKLYTVLTQDESCLNSHPLSPIFSDPTDLNPLTPGHFLIGDSLSAYTTTRSTRCSSESSFKIRASSTDAATFLGSLAF